MWRGTSAGNLTWVGPMLLALCVVGVWWFGGPDGLILLAVALAVTVAWSLGRRRAWSKR